MNISPRKNYNTRSPRIQTNVPENMGSMTMDKSPNQSNVQIPAAKNKGSQQAM